jgi:hypothetical protein
VIGVDFGLRGSVLARYAKEWILRIEDITPLVRSQHAHVGTDRLETPSERVYPCLPTARIDADGEPET